MLDKLLSSDFSFFAAALLTDFSTTSLVFSSDLISLSLVSLSLILSILGSFDVFDLAVESRKLCLHMESWPLPLSTALSESPKIFSKASNFSIYTFPWERTFPLLFIFTTLLPTPGSAVINFFTCVSNSSSLSKLTSWLCLLARLCYALCFH